MDQAEILDYAVKTLVIILELSMLPIVVATVIGILVSLIQRAHSLRPYTHSVLLLYLQVADKIM